jgi:hypothetical protein
VRGQIAQRVPLSFPTVGQAAAQGTKTLYVYVFLDVCTYGQLSHLNPLWMASGKYIPPRIYTMKVTDPLFAKKALQVQAFTISFLV